MSGLKKKKVRDLVLSILAFWILVYLFFAFVYWNGNPLEWKFSGLIIFSIVGAFGTKNEIYG
jgi:hypothetical protein